MKSFGSGPAQPGPAPSSPSPDSLTSLAPCCVYWMVGAGRRGVGQEILINEDFDDGVTFWVNNWGVIISNMVFGSY